jgi:hypothetical protein
LSPTEHMQFRRKEIAKVDDTTLNVRRLNLLALSATELMMAMSRRQIKQYVHIFDGAAGYDQQESGARSRVGLPRVLLRERSSSSAGRSVGSRIETTALSRSSAALEAKATCRPPERIAKRCDASRNLIQVKIGDEGPLISRTE